MVKGFEYRIEAGRHKVKWRTQAIALFAQTDQEAFRLFDERQRLCRKQCINIGIIDHWD
jgi:hypothetical protein